MDKKKLKRLIDVVISILSAIGGWLVGSAFVWFIN